MDDIIIFTGIVSVIAFTLHGIEFMRIKMGRSQLPTALMWVASVIAPFGALMGMLLCGTRLKNTALLVVTILLLIAFLLVIYLFRPWSHIF